jgi:hypothetical protein
MGEVLVTSVEGVWAVPIAADAGGLIGHFGDGCCLAWRRFGNTGPRACSGRGREERPMSVSCNPAGDTPEVPLGERRAETTVGEAAPAGERGGARVDGRTGAGRSRIRPVLPVGLRRFSSHSGTQGRGALPRPAAARCVGGEVLRGWPGTCCRTMAGPPSSGCRGRPHAIGCGLRCLWRTRSPAGQRSTVFAVGQSGGTG